MKNINEIWKDVPGFENKYQVSNLGNVRSLDRTFERKYNDGRKPHLCTLQGKMMKKSIDGEGYEHVRFYVKEGKAELWKVHQLVAAAFLGHDRKAGGRNIIVHHKNGKKNDNRLENLEVVTRKEHTMIHVLAYATIKPYQPRKWKKNVEK